MRITFCGTGAGILLGRGRAGAGIVVQDEGKTVMLDCGQIAAARI
jgi:ribonuclease BN (tRNA processing enzyme)